MTIGGYTLTQNNNGDTVEVKHYESGWSFFLQGDDAIQFLSEWETYTGENFESFLQDHIRV